MTFPNKGFQGKLHNKSIYDFITQLDFSLKQNDRINKVSEILYTVKGVHDNYVDDYFETYFDEKLKVNLKQSDYLSTDNNICNALESMANYILFADDAEKCSKQEYSFYSKEQLINKYGKDMSLEEMLEKTYNELENCKSISFLINEGYNYKKVCDQSILSSDIHSIEPIKHYEELKSIINKRLKNLRVNKTEKVNQKKMVKLLKELKTDQILCKDKIRGTIYFKAPLRDSTATDYNQFDYENPEHIIPLLECNGSLLTDVGCIKYDISNLLKEVKLKYNDCKILNYLFLGFSYHEIAKKLNLQSTQVLNKIKRISKQIAKKHNEMYEDWLYTYVLKGAYKKCTLCGAVKLKNSRIFRYLKPCNEYHSWCRSCEAKQITQKSKKSL